MGYINKKVLQEKAMQGLTEKRVQDELYNKVNQAFLRKKQELISNFENHPVTQEIRAGVDAANTSGTLFGGYGNLYTFIGFYAGDDPTQIVVQAFRNQTRLIKKAEVYIKGNRVYYDYRVVYPDKDNLADISPMPWEGGSWLLNIEKGISGLGYYMYTNFTNQSRSGRGIQSKSQVRGGGVFKRVSYISAILRSFEKGWDIK